MLLCGVRPDFAQVMRNLRFEDFLPDDQVFHEEPRHVGSFDAGGRAARLRFAGRGPLRALPATMPEPDRETFYYQI